MMVILMLAAVVPSLEDEAKSLLYRAKVGEILRYRVEMSFEDQGVKATLIGSGETRVDKVDVLGPITLFQKLGQMKLKSGNDEMDIANDSESTMIIKATGEIIEVRGKNVTTDNLRTTRATMVVVPSNPVKPGDTWTHQIPKSTGIRAMTFEYRAVGTEKIGARDTMKIEFKVRETEGNLPIQADGTAWLSTVDGKTVRILANVTNAPMGASTTKFTLRSERTD
ncbi:MAG TPA: hypothetical protein PLH94_09215 [Fimbriimonadaceae bacterium]|nr:hypothetical protein [Fimbriimonadaceae bacterium]